MLEYYLKSDKIVEKKDDSYIALTYICNTFCYSRIESDESGGRIFVVSA